MGLFAIYRHHLANAAHRRYLANNPSPTQVRRAQRKATRPVSGQRCSEQEWIVFERTWLPALQGHRTLMTAMYQREVVDGVARRDADRIARAEAALDELKEPITWVQISAYARRNGATAKRPPRALEKMLSPIV